MLFTFLLARLWKDFTPGGREKDGLVLRHWVKKGSVEDENGSVGIQVLGSQTGTYYFDQFNAKLDFPIYTAEEYELYMQGEGSHRNH